MDVEPLRSHERVPKRTLTLTEYKESVRRDLLWLLNTRTSFPVQELDARDLSVIDYGIPDFGKYYTANRDDQQRMRTTLRRFIEAFEPRLREVEVFITPVPGEYKRLQVVLEGMLVLDRIGREPVSFPLLLDLQQGRYAFHEWIE